MGVVTAKNVVAQVEGLLSVVADLCGAFPSETKSVDPGAWVQDLAYGKEALKPYMDSELVKRLHELRIHPDWQYQSVEVPRKMESDPPEGHGWVKNLELDDGTTRYDHTDHDHYRRLKTDALKDDIDLSSLPAITQSKIKLSEYLDLLREKFCKGYMRSSISGREFNSKPVYVRSPVMVGELHHGNEVYALESVLDCPGTEIDQYVKQMGKNIFFDDQRKPTLIYGLEVADLRILTNLNDDSTFVTTKRKDGTWQNWTKWYEYMPLPIDRFELNKILELI